MRGIVIITALVCAAGGAAAQSGAGAPVKRSTERHAPRVVRPEPIVIPQQFSPPQEAYASMPDAAAAAPPTPPSACQLRLAKVAAFQALPVVIGAGDCGATDAVQLQTITLADQSRVAVTPPAILRCPMAEQIAAWVRDDVAPSLKNEPPLRGLDNFDSYSCRGRNNIRAAQLSEHGRANAIDVRDFLLADGRELGLTDIHADKNWRETIRASACARFSTVLGPGSDGYHEQHVHLDLAERRNGYKLCQWDVRVPPPPVEAKAKESTTPAENAAAADLPAVPPIPIDEVPLPRPRPIAANAAPGKSVK